MADIKEPKDTARMYRQYWDTDKERMSILLEKMNNGSITKEEYQELQFILISQEWITRAIYPLCRKIIVGDKLLFIADTHYGSPHQNRRLVSIAYNEALRQSIKTVVHAGDKVEGCAFYHDKSKEEIIKEIETAKSDIPSELTVEFLLGNHEHNAVREYPDIVPFFFNDPRLQVLGMHKVIINWNENACIRIFHEDSKIYRNAPLDEDKGMITLEGHHHGYRFLEDLRTINLASLSNMSFGGLSETLMKKNENKADVFLIGEKVDTDIVVFHEYCLDHGYRQFAISESIELNTKTKTLKLYR